MKHPDFVFSHDLSNNCTIIQWGENGYYTTDYPEGKYPDDVIDYMNESRDITKAERKAMEICSMAAQNNPGLDWDKHYEMIMSKVAK